MNLLKALYFFLFITLFNCIPLNVSAQQQDTGVEVVDAPVVDTTYGDEDYTDEEEVVDTLLSFKINYFPDDSLKALLKQKEFAYINNLDSLLKNVQDEQLQQLKKQKPPTNISWIFNFFKYLLWFIVIAAAFFLIYRLFLSERGIFAASVRNKHRNTVHEELIDEDSLSRKARESEQAGNYRLAVRYQYLHALSIIAEKGWLQLSPDKTNYQYVQELSNKTIRNDFARITLHYEYAWYGNFQIEAPIFQTIKKEFVNFQTRLNQS